MGFIAPPHPLFSVIGAPHRRQRRRRIRGFAWWSFCRRRRRDETLGHVKDQQCAENDQPAEADDAERHADRNTKQKAPEANAEDLLLEPNETRHDCVTMNILTPARRIVIKFALKLGFQGVTSHILAPAL